MLQCRNHFLSCKQLFSVAPSSALARRCRFTSNYVMSGTHLTAYAVGASFIYHLFPIGENWYVWVGPHRVCAAPLLDNVASFRKCVVFKSADAG